MSKQKVRFPLGTFYYDNSETADEVRKRLEAAEIARVAKQGGKGGKSGYCPTQEEIAERKAAVFNDWTDEDGVIDPHKHPPGGEGRRKARYAEPGIPMSTSRPMKGN